MRLKLAAPSRSVAPAHEPLLVEQGEMPGFGAVPLVRIPGAPAWNGRGRSAHPAAVGEQSREILQEVGFSGDEIEAALAGTAPGRATLPGNGA